MRFFAYLLDLLCGAVPLCLLGVGAYFLVRLGVYPFYAAARCFFSLFIPKKEAKEALLQHTGSPKRKNAPSPLRAMLLSLGGTVGVGNIAGVSLALLVGGAGSIFFMWLSALFAMLLKYAEVTLAIDSRAAESHGGGTAEAMKRAGWRRAGGLFSLLCLAYVLTVGGAVQANAVSECFSDCFSLPPLFSALLLLVLSLPAAWGGGGRITRVTSYLVPLMCLGYVAATVTVIFCYRENLGAAFLSILTGAFRPDAAAGGVLGFLFSRAARVGVARGLMSNEGGCGTAPMAHATSTESCAARQGLLGMIEVFVDTCLICTLTALAVLCVFPTLPAGLAPMAIVRLSLEAVFGAAARPLLSLFLFLFAYATILCEAYYGQVSAAYLSPNRNTRVAFFALFGGAILFGALGSVHAVFYISDLVLAAMTLLNLAFLVKKADRVVTLSAALR